MKNKKQKLLLGAAVMASAVLLAGCGNGNTSASSGKKVTLTIATWANAQEQTQFNSILDKINKSQNQFEIKQQVIPGSSYYTKIQTEIAGQTAPDLMWLSQEYIPAYAQKGALVDLTSALSSQSKVNMSDYYSSALDAAKYDGKTYGLPWIDQPYVVYYNKAMFQAAGLSAPANNWTWSDFEKDATTLTKNGVYGYAADGTLPIEVPVWGEGGDLWTMGGKSVVNTSDAVKGLTTFYNISTNASMTMPYSEASSIGGETAFEQGKIAMVIGGADDTVEQTVQQGGSKFEVGMAAMPGGSKTQVTFSYIASTVISSQTKNKDIAQTALEDITNAMFDWKVPAPVKSKQDKIGSVMPSKAYAASVIKYSMGISRGFNNLPQSADLNNDLWNTLWLPLISNNNGKGGVNVQNLANQTNTQFENVLK